MRDCAADGGEVNVRNYGEKGLGLQQIESLLKQKALYVYLWKKVRHAGKVSEFGPRSCKQLANPTHFPSLNL